MRTSAWKMLGKTYASHSAGEREVNAIGEFGNDGVRIGQDYGALELVILRPGGQDMRELSINV